MLVISILSALLFLEVISFWGISVNLGIIIFGISLSLMILILILFNRKGWKLKDLQRKLAVVEDQIENNKRNTEGVIESTSSLEETEYSKCNTKLEELQLEISSLKKAFSDVSCSLEDRFSVHEKHFANLPCPLEKEFKELKDRFFRLERCITDVSCFLEEVASIRETLEELEQSLKEAE